MPRSGATSPLCCATLAGNKRQAAHLLGISRSTLLHKVRKYGLATGVLLALAAGALLALVPGSLGLVAA